MFGDHHWRQAKSQHGLRMCEGACQLRFRLVLNDAAYTAHSTALKTSSFGVPRTPVQHPSRMTSLASTKRIQLAALTRLPFQRLKRPRWPKWAPSSGQHTRLLRSYQNTRASRSGRSWYLRHIWRIYHGGGRGTPTAYEFNRTRKGPAVKGGMPLSGQYSREETVLLLNIPKRENLFQQSQRTWARNTTKAEEKHDQRPYKTNMEEIQTYTTRTCIEWQQIHNSPQW